MPIMAKYRTVAKVEHVVYDSMEEFKIAHPGEIVNLDWRKGRDGDWVLGDDGSVMEVLKYGKVVSYSPREYIRTASGTFVIWDKGCLDSNFRENIYSFSGRWGRSNRLSLREKAFVCYIILGCKPVEAYLRAFKTASVERARQRAYMLITKERIMTAIKEAVEEAGEQTGATLEWAMKTIKDTVEKTDKPSVKIRGASIVAELHTKDKSGGAPGWPSDPFQGFSVKELPEGERKQLPGATGGGVSLPQGDGTGGN